MIYSLSNESCIEWTSETYQLLENILKNMYFYSNQKSNIDLLFSEILTNGWTLDKVEKLKNILIEGYYHSDLTAKITALYNELFSMFDNASSD